MCERPLAYGLRPQVQLGHGREASGACMRPLGEKEPEGAVLAPDHSQHRPTRQLPSPTAGLQEPHWAWGPEQGDRAKEELAFLKPTSPGHLPTEPGSVTPVQEGILREPGRHGDEATDWRTLGLTLQHPSHVSRAPVLPEGPREAVCQPLETEPEDTKGSHRSLGMMQQQQLWGHLRQERPPLKGDQGRERLGGEEVDEDRDIDESSPQDSPPSQVSPSLQSSPAQSGPLPQTGSREATGTPGVPAQGASPVPVHFLSEVPTEPQVSEPDGPRAGLPEEGHGTPPEFAFHVEIKANVQKEQADLEVDLEGAALPGTPGEDREPWSPSEGEDTEKTDLPGSSKKQPVAGLPGKPVSRVPQLKGLCLELLHSTQAAGTAPELPAPRLLPLPRLLGAATKPAWVLLLAPPRPPPAPQALGARAPLALARRSACLHHPTQRFLPHSLLWPPGLPTAVHWPTGSWLVGCTPERKTAAPTFEGLLRALTSLSSTLPTVPSGYN